MWVLGIELRPSGKVVCAFNRRTICSLIHFDSFKAGGTIYDVDIVLSGYEKTGIFPQDYLHLLSMKNINWIIKTKNMCVGN